MLFCGGVVLGRLSIQRVQVVGGCLQTWQLYITFLLQSRHMHTHICIHIHRHILLISTCTLMVAAALNETNVGLGACLLQEWTLHMILGGVWHANMQNPLQSFPCCVSTSTELRSHLKCTPLHWTDPFCHIGSNFPCFHLSLVFCSFEFQGWN